MPAPIITLGYGPSADPAALDPTTLTGNVFTYITSDGAALIARQNVGHLKFTPVEFAVGVGGYDPLDPRHATIPDPLSVALEIEVYRSPIERFEAPTDSSLAIVCRIPPNTLRYGIGEIGIFVKLTSVSNNMPLPLRVANLNVGDLFLFTISHFPIRCIEPDQTDLHRIVVDL